MRRRLRLVVTGRVQGVCYRAETIDTAVGLGLTGWVRNRPDGSVEVVAEGEETALTALRDWCRRGPSRARVTGLQEEGGPATGEFTGFRVAW